MVYKLQYTLLSIPFQFNWVLKVGGFVFLLYKIDVDEKGN